MEILVKIHKTKWLSLALIFSSACMGELSTRTPPSTEEKSMDVKADMSADLSSDIDGSGETDSKPLYHIRRLTNQQLTRSLDITFRQAAGENTNFDRWLKLPKTATTTIFSNEVSGLVVGVGTLENTLESMENLVFRIPQYQKMTRGGYADCEDVDDSECTKRFIEKMGPKIYRRPLYEEEKKSLLAVYEKAFERSGEEREAYKNLLLVLFMSPYTQYLLEPPDSNLHAWQVASRLSYFLWGAPPDDELYSKAEDGSLLDKDTIRAQAIRMMEDPLFAQKMGQFVYELLDLTRFDSYYKTLSLDDVVDRPEMKQDFFFNANRHFKPGGTLTSLFTEENQFTDPKMIAYYDGQYPGILSHPVFQWTHSPYRTTSPIERGVAVRERLILCGHLPPPPMNVAAIPDNVVPGLTGRARLKQHREDPECSSCHELIDPLGLVFEGFDGNGLYRTEEDGAPIDLSGALTGTVQADIVVNGPLELQQKLVQNPQVQQCFVDQALRYALLRKLSSEDDPAREKHMQAFKNNNFELHNLILDIATSEIILFPWPEEKTQ